MARARGASLCRRLAYFFLAGTGLRLKSESGGCLPCLAIFAAALPNLVFCSSVSAISLSNLCMSLNKRHSRRERAWFWVVSQFEIAQ